MKKTALLLVIALALTLCGCMGMTGIVSYYYEDSQDYKIGNGTVARSLNEIDIDWINGEVELIATDADDISFSEEPNSTIGDDEVMRWLVDGDTLKIKYMKSGTAIVKDLSKDLTVYLPRDIYDEINISTVSADISIGEVACNEFEGSTTSGSIKSEGLSASSVEASTVSGKINLVITEKDCQEMSLNSTSGDINISLSSCRELEASTVSGRINITATGNLFDAEFNSTSGDIICTGGKILSASTVSGLVQLSPAAEYTKCDASTTSGDVILYLSDSNGFELEFDTASGNYTSDLALTKDGRKLIYGDGNARINVDTVSGSLSVKENIEPVEGGINGAGRG